MYVCVVFVVGMTLAGASGLLVKPEGRFKEKMWDLFQLGRSLFFFLNAERIVMSVIIAIYSVSQILFYQYCES